MPKSFDFDPDRVAYFEANGWRAYYDREWIRLLRTIIGLCEEQFRIPFPASLLAAYYVSRAAAAWAPVDHDEQLVKRFYVRFYRLAKKYSGLDLDPVRVATLELQYNEVHRRLVGREDKAEFVETMVALHGAIFGLTPEQARQSAMLRVLANNTVDLITSGKSTDIEGDWRKLEDFLRRCYRSIQEIAAISPYA